MKVRIALVLLLVASSAQAGGPIAEVICAPRQAMVQRLTATQGAALAATGLRDLETVLEIWTAPGGNWTLLQSYADGLACILAMGEDWEMPRLPDAG